MLVWLLFVVTRPSLWAAETSPSVELTSDTQIASEGYFVLSWTSSANHADLTLQQIAPHLSNSPITRAEQLPATGAITITGLADGDYAYRLVGDGEILSNSVSVTVAHHALSRALMFFLLGASLFGVLVGTIVVGRARTRESEPRTDGSHRGNHA